ncbi:hypothetical protein BCR43DRAFT_487043 [Syncephalastrum racemosum]|uniref:Uncharacterized protein n=1 Tax=Syncephalastrum racemosum TaxID=13706 RepID=A0A1X2HQ32_SYNRA|nr:hypothetical protein BCR43DRAFT_487043 [Syncephalastrum racemosum]
MLVLALTTVQSMYSSFFFYHRLRWGLCKQEYKLGSFFLSIPFNASLSQACSTSVVVPFNKHILIYNGNYILYLVTTVIQPLYIFISDS